jgi:hypothetical protein
MLQHSRLASTDFAHPTPSGRLGLAATFRIPRISRTARRILGLRRGEIDPVQIILAAQVRLRRWRRFGPAEPLNASRATLPAGVPAGEVRRIIRARDQLLAVANRQATAAQAVGAENTLR